MKTTSSPTRDAVSHRRHGTASTGGPDVRVGLLLSIAVAGVALACVALAVTAVLGHRDGSRPAGDEPRPVRDEQTAVCPTCASLVVGAGDGDPCPACGTPVSEPPRIRPRRQAAARSRRRVKRTP
jgi:hypothetical protein